MKRTKNVSENHVDYPHKMKNERQKEKNDAYDCLSSIHQFYFHFVKVSVDFAANIKYKYMKHISNVKHNTENRNTYR